MKKDGMMENVTQAQAALATGSIAAIAAHWRLTGALLGAGSGLLGYENVAENVANFALLFRSESLGLDQVCLITTKNPVSLLNCSKNNYHHFYHPILF